MTKNRVLREVTPFLKFAHICFSIFVNTYIVHVASVYFKAFLENYTTNQCVYVYINTIFHLLFVE